MDNVDTNRLIEELNLTSHEARALRYLAGLNYPVPRDRFDDFFSDTRKGRRQALFALLIFIAVLAFVMHSSWKWPFLSEHYTTWGLLTISFLLILVLQRRNRLVRKLYQALEGTRAAGAVRRT